MFYLLLRHILSNDVREGKTYYLIESQTILRYHLTRIILRPLSELSLDEGLNAPNGKTHVRVRNLILTRMQVLNVELSDPDFSR
jgi:hypothetical protein